MIERIIKGCERNNGEEKEKGNMQKQHQMKVTRGLKTKIWDK
jgi:hypothetical protein